MTALNAAAGYLAGRTAPLQTAIELLSYINPDSPVWKATGGSNGVLSALYLASDEIDRLGYIGDDAAWWHPDVRDEKAADLARTQERFSAPIRAACVAILEYKPSPN